MKLVQVDDPYSSDSKTKMLQKLATVFEHFESLKKKIYTCIFFGFNTYLAYTYMK